MNVLFLGQSANLEPWFRDVITAIGEAHHVVLFDPGLPIEPQFREVSVVIDQGGSVGTRPMIDAAAATGVRLWQVLGTGLDHVDVQYILDRGLPLANTPGPFSSVALAEHALLFMLYFAKNFAESQANMRAGVMYRPMNDELQGATLGLIGLGASARELAKRARPFGMRIVGLDIQVPPNDVLEALGIDCLGGPEALVALVSQSDYVSLHVPLTRRTRHLIDARALGAMQPHAVLINVARGGIVDLEALVDALRNGAIRGAGIDVFETEPVEPDSPLLHLDRVVLTPHIAGVTRGTSRRRAEAVAENVRRVANNLAPLYTVTAAE
jgi:phosphoglycerate dehydrogenase-like enzyme